MAVYKVPQDVEAEDKLIGPFSFRQFIYLIVAALAILAAWLLGQLFVGLAIIPLPVIVLFLVLALPLRKDQPMETYLIAVIRFFLKPRTRMWQPDGAIGLVQITAPKVVEQQLTKGIGGDEAAQRLGYLAQVVDSRGWSTRGVTSNTNNMSSMMVDDVAAEAQNVEDVLDDNAQVSRSFDDMIERNDTTYKQTVAQQFQQGMHQPAPVSPPVVNDSSHGTVADQDAVPANLDYDPYPRAMHQRIIDPHGQPQEQTPPPALTPRDDTSDTDEDTPDSNTFATPRKRKKPEPASPPTVSPDIMRLANNNDLSISAIAREAHRLEEKDDNEVVISLR